MKKVTKLVLQQYVNERAMEKTRNGTVGPITIRKELGTLSAVWSHCELGRLPKQGLKFPKSNEKPPFQTWREIERRIAAGAGEELWKSLFLTVSEIRDVLEQVKKNARFDCAFPMFAMAAYTGAFFLHAFFREAKNAF